MRDRPYSTLSAERRLAEQERRYRDQMGAEKAECHKALAEAERKRKRKPKPTEADRGCVRLQAVAAMSATELVEWVEDIPGAYVKLGLFDKEKLMLVGYNSGRVAVVYLLEIDKAGHTITVELASR